MTSSRSIWLSSIAWGAYAACSAASSLGVKQEELPSSEGPAEKAAAVEGPYEFSGPKMARDGYTYPGMVED